jgi:hypothetical protein
VQYNSFFNRKNALLLGIPQNNGWDEHSLPVLYTTISISAPCTLSVTAFMPFSAVRYQQEEQKAKKIKSITGT